MKAVERELDWGLSGDTCPACAKLRVAEALVTYFDGYLADPKRCQAEAAKFQYDNDPLKRWLEKLGRR